jgi:chromosome segregation ATPase
MSPLTSAGFGSTVGTPIRAKASSSMVHSPGRLDPASRADLSDSHFAGDSWEAAAPSVQSEISRLRRTLEETRTMMRQLQCQQKQDTRWRAETDEALENLRAKLPGLITRDMLDVHLQDLRKAADRKHIEVVRDVARRTDTLESTIEAVRASAENSLLSGDLGSFQGKLDASLSSPLRRSQLDSKFEIRLSKLEHQTSKLSSLPTGTPASQQETEATSLAESACRRAEAVERRIEGLEAAHESLQKKCSKSVQDVHEQMRDASEFERERLLQFQQGLEDVRERGIANHGAIQTSLVDLQANVEQQRLKLEEESRARQRTLRDLEGQLVDGAPDFEQLAMEAKKAATAASTEVAVELEARLEANRRKSAEHLQQVMARVQKAEAAVASVEGVSGSVPAILDRLSKLEFEELSKFERLESWLQERSVEMRKSIEIASEEHRSLDATSMSTLVAKLGMGTDRVEVDKRCDQLQRDLREVSGSIEALQDAQRRSSVPIVDVGRPDARQEVRRGMEEMAAKLRKVVEDLDGRLREFEPAFKELRDMGQRVKDLEKLSDRFEPRLNNVDTCVKDIKDMDVRLRDIEPRLRHLQEQSHQQHHHHQQQQQQHQQQQQQQPPQRVEFDHHLRDLEPRIRDLEKAECRWKEFEPQVRQVSEKVDMRFRELEFRISDLKEFEPRVKCLEPLLLRLEPQVKDVESRLKEVEPRIRDLEPRLKGLVQEFEPRIKDLEPRIKELEPRVRECERELAPRILKDLEPKLLRMQELEPRLAGLEFRLKELEPRIKDVEPRLMRLQDIEPRLRELEPKLRDIEPRVKDLEPRVKELEPRIKEFEPLLKELQLWSATVRPQFASLQQAVTSMEPRMLAMEPHLREFEPRLRDLGHEMERKWNETGDAIFGMQKTFESQLSECMSSVRHESAAWREALRGESASWRESCGDLRCRAEGTRDEMQQSLLEARELANRTSTEWRSEIAAEKIKTAQLGESLNELRQMLKERTEEASLKLEAKFEGRLSQSLNEVGWRLSRRIDEVDAGVGEARAAVDEHLRQLAISDRAHCDRGKDIARIVDEQRQGIASHAVSQAMEAVKAKLEETAKASERCEECCRQANRAVAELADVEKEFGRKFERWSSQTQEGTQVRLQERLQELLRSAITDMTAQLSSISERHCDKAFKQVQTEVHTEGKENAQNLREELLKAITDVGTKSERLSVDGRNRVETIATSLSTLNNEISRLDAQDKEQQSRIIQEERGREALEQGVATLRRGLEHQRMQINEVCERVVPSLRDLQGTLADERQSRVEEEQNFQEKLREVEGRSEEQLAAQRRMDSGLRNYEARFKEGLRDTEAAVLSVDRRVHALEEAVEERLLDLVHNELVTGVISQLETQQRSHLAALENKMDKIAHNLHKPSGNDSRTVKRASAEDRDAFRQRFRDALGDTLYVKKALHQGGQSLQQGGRSNSDICLHNEQVRRCLWR